MIRTDFWIQNSRHFLDFSKTIGYFSSLKVTKEVINRHIEKNTNKAFFTMHCKRLLTAVL